jgi:hypothetical protein
LTNDELCTILQRVELLLGSDRKQVSTATNQHATEELLEAVFSVVRTTTAATQRRGKHVCAAMNQYNLITTAGNGVF